MGALRVLYSFPHPLGSPGIGRTAWHQVDGLRRRGHQVHVVATRLVGPAPAGVTVVQSLPGHPGRAVGRLVGRDRTMALHDAVAAAVLRSSRRGFDVVHTWPVGGLKTIRTAARRGVAAVRELPNTHTEHAYDVAGRVAAELGLASEASRSHAYQPERLAREVREYEEATAVLAPSDPVARTFLDRGFDPARVLRHRYGFDPDRFRLDVADRSTPAPGALRALFVGRAEPRKGLHLALRAWLGSRASETGTFTVCGALAGEYRTALAEYLDHPSVQVRGYVDDPEAAYATHDVLVLPSLEEGSALVTYEAAAMGCVPLVSDATGAAGVDGETALVHPAGDWEVLARHLDRLAGDPDELAALRKRCLDGRDDLTWAAGVEQTELAYRDALTLQGAPTRKAERR